MYASDNNSNNSGTEKDKTMKSEETAAEKAAVAQVLKKLAQQTVKIQNAVTPQVNSRANEKKSDSHLACVSILNDEKPTYAGETQEKLTPKKEEPVLAAEGDTTEKSDIAAEKALLNKMSVVLSRAVRHAMAGGQGYTPANVGLSGRPTPMPAAAPPMPVGAPQAQQQPQQRPQNPAQYQAALGGAGAMSPSSNPINSYGPISASGDINGNAAFGVKNSPGSSKNAGSMDAKKYNDFVKLVSKGDSKEINKVMQRGGADASNLSAMIAKARSHQRPSAKQAGSPAWQRAEGKNDEGGLNAKGRASYNKATGGNLKAPVTESNPTGDRAKRQNSFCARMCGMKKHETGADTKKDPDSRINKSLSKWNCKCGSALEFGALVAGKSAASVSQIIDKNPSVEEGKKVEDVKPTFTVNENKADLDPTEVIAKAAQWAEKEARSYTWGGQRWQLGQTGINPQAGYGYLMGMIPTPDVALRIGTPSFGAGIGLHPLPYVFFDKGQPSGRHGKQPRSLYKYLGDNMMSPEDAFFIELGQIPDGAGPERFEKLLRDRGIGRTSQEIKMLSEVLASSPDVKRNAMTRRLPAAMNKGVAAANINPAPSGAKSLADIKPEGMKIGADMMAPYLKQNQRYQQLNRYAGLVTPMIANQIGRVAGVGPLAGFGATAAHMGVGHALNKQRQMMKSVQSMQNIFGK